MQEGLVPAVGPGAGLAVRGAHGAEGWEHPKHFLRVVNGPVRRAGGTKLHQKVTH